MDGSESSSDDAQNELVYDSPCRRKGGGEQAEYEESTDEWVEMREEGRMVESERAGEG